MKKFLLSAALVAAAAMTVSAADAADAPETPASSDYYLVGGFQGWNADAPTTKFTEVDETTYTITLEGETEIGQGFKINNGLGWGGSYGAGEEYMVLGEEYALVGGSQSNLSFGPKYLSITDATFTLKVAEEGLTVTVTGTLTEDPNYVEGAKPVLYLRGDMNGWGADESNKFTWSDNLVDEGVGGYYLRNVVVEGTAEAPAGFKVADAGWTTYQFGAGEGTVTLDEGNQESILFNNGGNAAIAATGTFNFYFFTEDFKQGTVEYYVADDDPYVAGVESIVVDENAPVVYYNMMGVEVANPSNGLYIAKQGNKATKVLVK